jgi:RimJ/RimL family protein N-acetyltransferase
MTNVYSASFGDFYLRALSVDDVGQDYLKWVSDSEVTDFLEIKYNTYTLNDLKEYVASFENERSRFLFGIFDKGTHKHIGNGTINSINYHVGVFDVGYFIGEKEYWGKNTGLASLLMLKKIAFEDLNLRKIISWVYANNIRNRFVLQRIGYTEEATIKERFLYKGEKKSAKIYTLTNEEWFGKVKPKFQI